jgi:lipopolysaccharide export system protein LptC
LAPPRKLIDRAVAWSPVFFLGGLAALTYWLDAQVQPGPARVDGSARHDPDLYIEQFAAVSFDPEGRLRQSLSARRAQHYPDDGSVDFVAPALALTDPGTPRLTAAADAGTFSGDRETVTLRGNVRATRDAIPGREAADGGPQGPITFTTELLRVIPRRSRAETDAPVTIAEPRGTIHATGMVFDNNARTVKLKSGVRGTLQPQPLPK